MTISKNGLAREEVLEALRRMRGRDADWRNGRTFSLVYFGGEELLATVQQAYNLFFSENALNPMAFPSLRDLENEVLAMTAGLLNGGADASGTMTSGGTESILMAVKAARERARAERPGVTDPEMVIPVTVHPAFEKAAHYLGV